MLPFLICIRLHLLEDGFCGIRSLLGLQMKAGQRASWWACSSYSMHKL